MWNLWFRANFSEANLQLSHLTIQKYFFDKLNCTRNCWKKEYCEWAYRFGTIHYKISFIHEFHQLVQQSPSNNCGCKVHTKPNFHCCHEVFAFNFDSTAGIFSRCSIVVNRLYLRQQHFSRGIHLPQRQYSERAVQSQDFRSFVLQQSSHCNI